jgi:Sulfotransferase family
VTGWAGPVAVGGTGGSGTRVVARLLLLLGVAMGSNRNAEEDAVPFADFDWQWGPELFALQLAGHDSAPGVWTDAVPEEAERQFLTVLRAHRTGESQWGWKHPHSYLLLPFLGRLLPDLRFVHVLRDGRDVALSGNQRQLELYGPVLLGDGLPAQGRVARSAAFWSRANCLAADYAERRLAGRYLRVRLEDLCADPERAVSRLAALLGLSPPDGAQRDAAARMVNPPSSLGRWRHEAQGTVDEVTRAAGPGLVRFGYAVEGRRTSQSM